ncbi:MAG: SRPBCC domain-containing protein [Proteobacteria bacterium]|nr:SRPBCC domain-containing protein [Pseudomonadota bacterium]
MPAVSQESLNSNSTTHIHEIYIKASAVAIWDALTKPEWTSRYGYRALSHYELKPGGKFRCVANDQMQQMGLPEVIVDGEVLEVRAPHKLVQSYRFLFNAEHKAEGFTKITWEVVPTEKGFCRVTVTHDTAGAPMMMAATRSKFDLQGGGGWNWILSDLKSLLETGKTLDA